MSPRWYLTGFLVGVALTLDTVHTYALADRFTLVDLGEVASVTMIAKDVVNALKCEQLLPSHMSTCPQS
jgi:hypothetical protein